MIIIFFSILVRYWLTRSRAIFVVFFSFIIFKREQFSHHVFFSRIGRKASESSHSLHNGGNAARKINKEGKAREGSSQWLVHCKEMEREFFGVSARETAVDESASRTHSTARLSPSISTPTMKGNSSGFFWLKQAVRNRVVVLCNLRIVLRDTSQPMRYVPRRNSRIGWQAWMKKHKSLLNNVISHLSTRLLSSAF